MARHMNRITLGLNQIADAIQIAIESNRDLILPITGMWIANSRHHCRDVTTAASVAYIPV